jgi:NDP-sugar pyrophosphorylase family protein
MKALILAGGQDTRQCPLTMVRPRAMFPVSTDVLLKHSLKTLHSVGVDEAVICADGKTHIVEAHFEDNPSSHVELGFQDEGFPRGTAGCLRDTADFLTGNTFLVVEGSLFLDGDLRQLIDAHARNGSAMTLGAVRARDWRGGNVSAQGDEPLSPLGVYVVEPEVLDHIPERSYCDIKEQLIPLLQKRGLDVVASKFEGRHRRILDASSYGTFVAEILNGVFGDEHFSELTEVALNVWVGKDARIAPSAELTGPVVVGRNAVIGEKVMVIGPTVIGENVVLDDQAVVEDSILWPNVTVGLGARVEHSIITDSFHVSVFQKVSESVAIDQELSLGDMHGLSRGGYAVGVSGRAGPAIRKARSPVTAIAKAWRRIVRSSKKNPPGKQDSR